MAKVRLLNGKPLLVGGKVALSDDCCCSQPTTCPPDGSPITVRFAGVLINCGCFASGGEGIIGTDISVNGSFSVPSVGGGQWQGDGGQAIITGYTNTDCTGVPVPTLVTGFIVAVCTVGQWQIEYSFEGSFDAFENGFRGGEVPVASPVPNLAACASGFGDIGHGGTATIS